MRIFYFSQFYIIDIGVTYTMTDKKWNASSLSFRKESV